MGAIVVDSRLYSCRPDGGYRATAAGSQSPTRLRLHATTALHTAVVVITARVSTRAVTRRPSIVVPSTASVRRADAELLKEFGAAGRADG